MSRRYQAALVRLDLVLGADYYLGNPAFLYAEGFGCSRRKIDSAPPW
jgi:hypothetical protein